MKLIHQKEVQVLGIPLVLKFNQAIENRNVFNIIGINKEGEARHLYVYLVDMDALQPNKKEVDELVSEYERQTGAALKILIAVSDAVIWVINTFMSIVTGIFGGIGGFGLIGIAVVLAILFAILVLWIYALVIIVPLMALSYGIKIWLDKNKEKAVKTLSRETREIAREITMGVSPAISSGSPEMRISLNSEQALNENSQA